MEPLQFKLDPLQYPAMQKKMVFRSVLLIVIIFTILSVYVLSNASRNDDTIWVDYLIFMVLVYTVLITRSVKKRKKIYDSYIIIIDDSGITRIQDKLADLHIPITGITSIEKKTNNNFIIKGASNNPFEKITISRHIEGYQTVEEILSKISPITFNVKTTVWEKYSFLLSIAVAIPLLGVYFADNKVIVSVSAVIAVTGLVYSFFCTLRYRNAMKGLKRGLWTIPLILLSVLLTVYLKLIA